MKSYDPHIKQWKEYVSRKNISVPTEVNITNFLAELDKKGLSHSTLNLARSAVSAYSIKHRMYGIGSDPRVCRLIKRMLEKKNSLPRSTETWDVDKVLDWLDEWPSLEDVQLKDLTLRTIMLLVLLSGQSRQSIHLLLVEDIKVKGTKCIIVDSSVLKQTKASVHIPPLELDSFQNEKLCIVSHLKAYIEKTESLQQGKELFVSYVKPHKRTSRDTLSRWIKSILDMAGIDSIILSAHSTRAASTSAVYNTAASIDSIVNAAGWSKDSTFKKFYWKLVQKQKSLSQAVLDNCVQK